MIFFGSRRTTIKQAVNPQFNISSNPSNDQNPPTFKMKMIIAFAALVAVAVAAPPAQQEGVAVVKETLSNNIGVGGYNYAYELSNGETKQETGELVNAGTENAAVVVKGSFSWVDAVTGQQYTVTYTADQNGFHPVGEHIPA